MTGLDTAATWCQKLCGHLMRGAATNCPWQTSSPHRGRQTISEVQIPPGSCQTILTDRFQHTETLGLPWSIPGQTCMSVSLPHSHLLCLHTSMLGGSVYSTQASGGGVFGTKLALPLCLSHRGKLLKPLSGAPSPTQQASKFPHRGPPTLSSSELDFGGRVISWNHPISHSCTMTGGLGFTPNLPGNWYFT